ncbi:MAG: hypothetical protein ACLSGH_12240 [Faecalibacillus intestinalis]|uniref:hypothetical protein n=1 Tax=Faecalibacillus intestinalis TaxID=1982626 RepID=UPI003992860C
MAGTGLTDWTQAVDPSTDDGQYINEKTSHSNMMAYTPSVSYSGELIPNNEFVRHIYEVGKKEVIGSMFDEYEIETWAPVEGSTGCFAAHHRQYEIQPSNPGSGEGGGKIALEGTFAQKGASEHGQYNVATGEFTAGEYDYTTGKFTAASPQSGASSTPGSK